MAFKYFRFFEAVVASGALALGLGGCAGSAVDDEFTSVDEGAPTEPLRRAGATLRATRPAGVPADFIVTPSGYMHPSCVLTVREDEVARADGDIQRADGSVLESSPCRYPRYDVAGRQVPHAGARANGESDGNINADAVPAFNGWVESANDASNGPLNWISANWTVPPAPLEDVGQTLFYFPGIQPIEQLSEQYTILQPVLRWYSGVWTIESWNCCVEGNANMGPAAVVSSGDTLYGYVQGDGCDARGVCSNWFVHTGDWTNGAHSWLRTSAYGNVMGWAFGGVLEVYGVDDCEQYPPSGSITFSNIQTRSTSYQQVYPTWNVGVTSEPPQCGYGVSAPSSSTVTLFASPD